jgi:hypothetical protein
MTPELVKTYQVWQNSIRAATRMAAIVDEGPSYQHLSYEEYLGGPPSGIHTFLREESFPNDIPVPGEGITLGQFIQAQSVGAARPLVRKGLPVITLTVPELTPEIQQRLAAIFVQVGQDLQTLGHAAKPTPPEHTLDQTWLADPIDNFLERHTHWSRRLIEAVRTAIVSPIEVILLGATGLGLVWSASPLLLGTAIIGILAFRFARNHRRATPLYRVLAALWAAIVMIHFSDPSLLHDPYRLVMMILSLSLFQVSLNWLSQVIHAVSRDVRMPHESFLMLDHPHERFAAA